MDKGLYCFMFLKDIYIFWDLVCKVGMFGYFCNQRSLWDGWFIVLELKWMFI